jgi:glutamine synthetase
MVSDVYFCLFDQEKWTKNNLHLTFWSNIRSLVTIKKMIKGDTCRFFWKQKNKKKHYEMIMTIENSNEIVNLMLDKMSKFGIDYKVSKHNLGPKQGVIPAVDIETVEKNIAEYEAKVEDNPDMELMQYLMSLYDKVR